MAKRGRPAAEITLTGNECRQLESWARRHSTAQNLAMRCKIVLACACPEELTGKQIAREGGMQPGNGVQVAPTLRRPVSRWSDRRTAPAARTIGDDVVEQIVIDTLETLPKDATHWSTRSMTMPARDQSSDSVGDLAGVRVEAVGIDEFKISPHPQLVAKIRDIVGLYMNPPVNAAVFAVDEKPQIQALNRTAPMQPMMPTSNRRRSHDYKRNGTIDLFAALDIASGQVITELRPNHDSVQFIKFLNRINREVPAELGVHVVLGNLSTHKTPAVHKWLLRHKRFTFHFTPTYGSWMNLVERWFCALTTKTADEILERLGHYCADVTNTEFIDGSA